ncbi:MAG: HTH-type transcriptional regulator, sugar sensing transcriptional regulator [Patescibacteria group bacterium]|jgi:predicted DNA-binding transcriptional regulator|nr:HTH-type transcriptional regulator, sugar sensing transcriptional regulator [Patescibacteria group bacterium]
MIESKLKELGFQDKEITIYLELMRRGKATPASISKATGINRATVYSVSAALAEKGVISEDLAGKSSYLVAKPPEALMEVANRLKREAVTKEGLVREALTELSDVALGTKYSVPKVRFIEDENLKDHLYAQAAVWNASMRKIDPEGYWWGFQDHTFVEHHEEWIRWFWESVDPDVRLRLLSNESDIEEKMKTVESPGLDRREVRFWDRPEEFNATTWVVGEYIIMIYTREKPFYLIEIYNAVLADNMRSLFKGLWEEVVVKKG